MYQKVLAELNARMLKHEIDESDCFGALSIADALGISRNSASQHLNKALQDGLVVKVNSRPVLFFVRSVAEEKLGVTLTKDVYLSLSEMMHPSKQKREDFEKLIGSDNSLLGVVDQCKAAISYPSNGLPLLIYGPTGTGKSMIASILYEYAINHSLLKKEDHFVAINCSEYANNPELLTASLFGHVKGAYTGAEENNLGLLAAANEGFLFLDEVHCLSAKCQEKLFFFMDKGMYHQVGDNVNWLHSKCRIVFATTENPQEVLLKTLLRRIPIMVQVPSLLERPLIEKRQLIYSVFHQESITLKRKIFLSNLVYQALMEYEFVGNIGALKNTIKAICAHALLSQKDDQESMNVHLYDMPTQIVERISSKQLKEEQENRDAMIPVEKLKDPILFSSPLIHQYEKIMRGFKEYQTSQDSFSTYCTQLEHTIQNYIDYVVYKNRYRKAASDDYVLKMVDKIYSIIINKYSVQISNSDIAMYANIISDYANNSVDTKLWVSSKKHSVLELSSMLQVQVPREYSIAKEVVANLSLNLDLNLDDIMLAILTVSLLTNQKEASNSTIALVLCHGYSTASSIADAANRMLGEYIFDGIDMELDVNADKMVMRLNQYLKQKGRFEELLILVDMGSLEEIYKKIKPLVKCNIGILNNVTTSIALHVGFGIQQDKSIESILKQAKENHQLSMNYVEGRAKQDAILTTCATGFGTSKKISELLTKSLPSNIPYLVIPYEYQSLLENGEHDAIFDRYNVKLIIGTLNPKINEIPFVPVEEIVMDSGVSELEKLIYPYLSKQEVDVLRQTLMKSFTLANIVDHLTILNAKKVIEDVEDVVDRFEKELHLALNQSQKAGLYVHLSCLIERLLLKESIMDVANREVLIEEHKNEIDIVRHAFSVVESRYSVEISDVEILFILNYFKKPM